MKMGRSLTPFRCPCRLDSASSLPAKRARSQFYFVNHVLVCSNVIFPKYFWNFVFIFELISYSTMPKYNSLKDFKQTYLNETTLSFSCGSHQYNVDRVRQQSNLVSLKFWVRKGENWKDRFLIIVCWI